MPHPALRRNLPLYYLYILFRRSHLWLPTYVIFFQEVRGFSLMQIALLDSIFWLTTALSEVPTGIIADRWGRKLSMILGLALYSVAMLACATLEGFFGIAVAYFIWGIALTLTSGADEAIVYDTVDAMGRGVEYPRVVARAELLTITAGMFGGLLGGLLAAVDLALPFFLSTLFGVVALVATLLMREPRSQQHQISISSSLVISGAVSTLRNRPGLLDKVLYVSIVPAGALVILMVYIQPYAVGVGFPVEVLGFVVAAFNILRIFGAWLAPQLLRKMPANNLLWVILGTLCILPLTLSLVHGLKGVFLMALIGVVSSGIRPIVMPLIHEQVSADNRATVISLQSLLLTLVMASISPVLGWLADTYGLNHVFLALAVLLLIYGVFRALMQFVAANRRVVHSVPD